MPAALSNLNRRYLLLMLGTGALLLLLLIMTRQSPPPTAREVPLAQVELRDGRWYCRGETIPFTGIITEDYADGIAKSRCEVAAGLLHGVSKGWHTNGQLQIVEHFRSGISSGLRTKWHPNGRKMAEVMIVEGKLEGTFRRWTEAGDLSEEIELRAGQPHGLSRAYHPDGSLRAEARLSNGQVLEQKFWPDNQQPGDRVRMAGR